MRVFLIAALFVAFLAIVFALQNAAPIIVTFGVWQVRASLALILLMTLGLGLISGLLVSTPAIIRRNMQVSKQKRQINELKDEVSEIEQELTHQQQLLAQAHADIVEQQALLDRTRSPNPLPPSLLPEAPQREVAQLESAELIDEFDDTEDWV